MDSQIKLIEMTKSEMTQLRTLSLTVSTLSALLACLSVATVRLSSLNRPPVYVEGSAPYISKSFLIFELVLMTLALAASLLALLSCTLRSASQPLDSFHNHRRAVSLLIISAALFSTPFRPIAQLLQEDALPNFFLVYCADACSAMGTNLLFIYLWWYPFLCSQQQLFSDDPQRRKLPLFQFLICLVYTVLRLVSSLGLKIHFKPLPLQNGLALLSIVTHGEWDEVQILDSIAIIILTAFEIVIIAYVTWDIPTRAKVLVNAIDISSHQIVIAMRYFSQSAALFAINVLFIALVSALESSAQPLFALSQTESLLLSHPLGNSAVSIAVTVYSLREFYVHHKWTNPLMWVWLWRKAARLARKESFTSQEELVYRVSDERNPVTEYPVPGENVFSLETATLLFNLSWLASMYTGEEEGSPDPEDFGRPGYMICSEIMGEDKVLAALVLESMDRIVVAFKPVAVDTHRQSFLVSLCGTKFGSTLCGNSSDLEVLRTKPIPRKGSRLFEKFKVHAGFATVYSSIQLYVLQEVERLIHEHQRPVFVTGYSSGGAMATLCALDLSLRQFVPQGQYVSIYTFGSPKVMNSSMVRFFHKHVPFRWRCVVSGDSFSVQPISSAFRHVSKVATFTRNGHLAIEYQRAFKWWQSQVSVHPMHKLSAYYCALENWHAAFHIKRPIDLWKWPVEASVRALFKQHAILSDSRWPLDSALDSPTPDIESRSVRRLDAYFAASSDMQAEDVVAFSR